MRSLAPAMIVANMGNWLGREGNLATAVARGVGIAWALVMASAVVIAARQHHVVYTSHHECSTDPRDVLQPGELLDRNTLRFIVRAHCKDARYLPDGWIEYPFEGTPLGVKTSQQDIGGTTYYKIEWVAGLAAP